MVLAIWVYLLIGRGGFWLGRERDDAIGTGEGPWPAIVAVIPARDEAESVGRTITSLLQQDYPGEISILLVDDQSRDGTAEVARAAAASLGGPAGGERGWGVGGGGGGGRAGGRGGGGEKEGGGGGGFGVFASAGLFAA